MLMLIIPEHPAYPYSATDVAKCRDGDVSRVSLKYDAAESSPGLLSTEWHTPPCSWTPQNAHLGLQAWNDTPPCSWSFQPVGFSMQAHVFFRDTWHHPYICSCFCGKCFYSYLYTRDSGISSKAAFLYVDTSNLVLVLLHLFDTRLD